MPEAEEEATTTVETTVVVISIGETIATLREALLAFFDDSSVKDDALKAEVDAEALKTEIYALHGMYLRFLDGDVKERIFQGKLDLREGLRATYVAPDPPLEEAAPAMSIAGAGFAAARSLSTVEEQGMIAEASAAGAQAVERAAAARDLPDGEKSTAAEEKERLVTGKGATEEVYEGQMANGKRNGLGVYFYSNGDVYAGEWKHDRRDGKGVLTRSSPPQQVQGPQSSQEPQSPKTPHAPPSPKSPTSATASRSELDAYLPGDVQEGEWKTDKFHGLGVLRCSNGDVISGSFAHGVAHGVCNLDAANGVDVFYGDFTQGLMHGTIVAHNLDDCTTSPPQRYEYGRPQGQDPLLLPAYRAAWDAAQDALRIAAEAEAQTELGASSAAAAEGEAEPPGGLRAFGTLSTSEYDYRGEILDGVKDGLGVQKFKPGGDTFSGQFVLGKKQGLGVYQTDGGKGGRYAGEFRDDHHHGKGSYRYAAGSEYVGDWVDGKMHGMGVYRRKISEVDHEEFDGRMRVDKMDGPAFYRHANGEVSVGLMHNDKVTGHNIYFFKNGDVAEGEFVAGKLHGQAQLRVSKGGDVLEGVWDRGKKPGKGQSCVLRDAKCRVKDL